MKKNKIILYEKKKIISYLNKEFKLLQAGDILIVLYRYKYYTSLVPLIRQFVGLCLGKSSHYKTSTLIVRNIIDKEGVEFHINAFSPNVLSLKKSKMKKNNYIRNKLYYLRHRIAWESTILQDTILF